MLAPGIKKEKVENLQTEEAEMVKNHLANVITVIKKKKGLLEGKQEEFGEFMTTPKDEAGQILTIIEDVEDHIPGHLHADLLATEVNLRQLLESILEEHAMILAIEGEPIDTRFEHVHNQMDDEILLGRNVEHQLNLAFTLKKFASHLSEEAAKLEDSKWREKVGKTAENVHDLVSYISNLIMQEELPELKVAYTALKLEGWNDLDSKISEARSQFINMQGTKLL